MLTPEEKKRNREIYREKQKKTTRIIWIVLAALIFVPLFGRTIWGPIGVNITYSHGERVVKIVKVSDRGLFWKTCELEGVLMPSKGFAVTYIWSFSIDNADPNKDMLVKKINDAFEAGQTVRIKYEQKAGSVPWRSKTPYLVKEVIVLE